MKEIFIVPIGDVPAEIMDVVAGAVGNTFGVKVRERKGLPLPRHAHDPERGQYNATSVMRELRASRPEERGILLGVTMEDLYAAGLNYIFGEADIFAGMAVIALARLRQEFYGYAPDSGMLSERAVKEAIHELGHVLGLDHCQDPKCVMFFSNSIVDTDTKGSAFCGKCRDTLGI
jgi:archaemetzincin